MIFSSMFMNVCRRTSYSSIYNGSFAQKASTLNVYLLTRSCFRTNSSDFLFQRRIEALSRVQHLQSNRIFVPQCRGCLSLKTVSYSSESPKPHSRLTRHSLRGKTRTNGSRTVLKENKDSQKAENGNKMEDATVVEEAKLSVFQRFKKAYKEHAKILVVVHLVTSSVWFGSFFYAAHMGIDIIPVLEKLGFSDKIINPFRNSSLGDIALAYLMYKLATPARYTVTLAGTNFAIKYLRKAGKVPAKQKGLVAEAVKYGSTQTRQHMSHRFTNVKRRLEVRRLKMRRDARHFSKRLKTRWQSVSRNRTLSSHQRDKLNGRKTAGHKS